MLVAVGCAAPQATPTGEAPGEVSSPSPTPTADALTLLRTQTARTAAPAIQNTSLPVLTAAPLIPQPGITPTQATTSGTGKIAFLSNRDRIPEGMPAANSQHPAEIYVMDGDGSNQRRVTFGDGWRGGVLQWYADGQKLLFTGAISRSLVIEVATGRVVAEPNWEYAPVLSPDGSRIAHQQAFCFPPPYTDCSLQLFVLDLKTGQERILAQARSFTISHPTGLPTDARSRLRASVLFVQPALTMAFM